MHNRKLGFTRLKCLFAIAFVSSCFGLSACDDEDDKGRAKLDASSSGSVDGGAADGLRLDAAAIDAAGIDALLDGATDTSDDAGGDAGLSAAQVVGFYSGDWGDMVLKQVGNEIWGAYTHDDGTIVGTFQDGVLMGWWSEVPSRLPINDAGEVEFRFVLKDGVVAIDGRWKYGSDEAWRENWDITLVQSQPPAALVERFNDTTAFRRHP